MNLREQPYRSLLIWSFVCLLPILPLWAIVAAPISPDCFEYCNLGASFAMGLITWITVAWLIVVLVVAWRWRDRAPQLPAIAALGAGIIPVVVDLDALLRADYAPEVVSVVATALTLPPIWHLARSARPAAAGRLAVAVIMLAALISTFALLILGTSVYDSTYEASTAMLDISYLAFSVGLTTLAILSWNGLRAERPGLALLAATSLLGIVLQGLFTLLPYSGGEIRFFNPLPFGPVIALPGYFLQIGNVVGWLASAGWLWIGVTWFRSARTAPPVPLDDEGIGISRGGAPGEMQTPDL